MKSTAIPTKTAAITAAVALLIGLLPAKAQQPAADREHAPASVTEAAQTPDHARLRSPLSGESNDIAGETRIGPDDLLEITVFGAEELDRVVRVSSAGEISLPLIGVVAAAGRTVNELQREIEMRLAERFMHEPQVSVFLKELNSQGVAVFGAVAKPGVYQLRGPSSLVEVLSLAGGLAEDAGDRVLVTRSAAEGLPAVAETDLKELLQSGDPRLNLPVRAGDIVRVPRAGLVYVIGEVRKPGGFLLRGNGKISVLQALALAEGLLRTAARGSARIIRSDANGGGRREISIDLGRILAGKAPDPQLEPRDIVFVPNSAARGAFYRGTEAALGIVSGLIIFRR